MQSRENLMLLRSWYSVILLVVHENKIRNHNYKQLCLIEERLSRKGIICEPVIFWEICVDYVPICSQKILFTCLQVSVVKINQSSTDNASYTAILHFLMILYNLCQFTLSLYCDFQSDESSQHILLAVNLSRFYFIFRLTWQIK